MELKTELIITFGTIFTIFSVILVYAFVSDSEIKPNNNAEMSIYSNHSSGKWVLNDKSEMEWIPDKILNFEYQWGNTLMNCGAGTYFRKVNGSDFYDTVDRWIYGGNETKGLHNVTCIFNSTDEFLLSEGITKRWFYKDGVPHSKEYNYPIVKNYYGSPFVINNNRIVYTGKGLCDEEYSNCNWSLSKSKKGFRIDFVANGTWESDSVTNISGCGTTLSIGGNYTMNESLACPNDGIIIGANGITLDMKGFSINHSDAGRVDYGIDNTGMHSFLTVFNGSIIDFGRGLNQEGANGNFYDLLITSGLGAIDITGAVRGISLPLTSEDNDFENITISLVNNDNAKIDPNTWAVWSDRAGISNWINTNIIQVIAGGGGVAYGFSFESVDDGVTITNSKIGTVSCIGCPDDDILLIGAFGTNNLIVTNTTYSLAAENVTSGSDLTRWWYHNPFVNNTNGNNVSGATVKVVTPGGSIRRLALTLDSGKTLLNQLIRAYANNGGARTPSDTIDVSKEGYLNKTSDYNGTTDENNLDDNIQLDFCWFILDDKFLVKPITCAFDGFHFAVDEDMANEILEAIG